MPAVARVVAIAAITIFSLSLGTARADAHERRNVGPYQFVVGWASEPSFAGTTNGVSLRVTDTRTDPAKGVEGLEKTLAVDVTYAGLSRAISLPLRAVFGQPGLYQADLIPTRSGGYTFVFKGKVGSTDVNERFGSGPGRFNDVEPITELQYPDAVPAGAELDRRLVDIASGVDQVRILAIAALVLGVASIALSLVRRRA